jgi:CO dehydrogenase/acetyl-CoA synthase alpha subunit
MQARLSLSIDTDILKEVKKLSAKKNMNISEMVEDYFKIITKPKRKLLTEILDELPRVQIPENKKLSTLYYKAARKKYGL